MRISGKHHQESDLPQKKLIVFYNKRLNMEIGGEVFITLF